MAWRNLEPAPLFRVEALDETAKGTNADERGAFNCSRWRIDTRLNHVALARGHGAPSRSPAGLSSASQAGVRLRLRDRRRGLRKQICSGRRHLPRKRKLWASSFSLGSRHHTRRTFELVLVTLANGVFFSLSRCLAPPSDPAADTVLAPRQAQRALSCRTEAPAHDGLLEAVWPGYQHRAPTVHATPSGATPRLGVCSLRADDSSRPLRQWQGHGA